MSEHELQLASWILQLAGLRPEQESVQLLAQGLVQAGQSWPELSLPPDEWGPYLAQRLPQGNDGVRQLANLRVDELYLCCGCVHGDAQATALFHQHFVPTIDAVMRKMRLGEALRQDLRQALVMQLLVGDGQRPPELAGYRGLGRLAVWLRVVVSRAARKGLHKAKKEVPGDDQRIEEELVGRQLELPQLRASYRDAFRRAFRQALRELGPREQTLLRYRYVDGLSLEHIGAVYSVHLSTIHRWLDRLRGQLVDQTHRILAQDLNVPANECSTIIRMIQSDFDMTLMTFMGKRD